MREYLTTECIKKYGASAFLRGLRKRYCAGLYTKDQFVLQAAKTYCALAKPLRAMALLASMGSPDDRPAQRQELSLARAEKSLPTAHPGCSLNMIVKNERSNVAAALDSIDDIMDEIVICDTGSTDDTRDIVRLYGARVLSIDWRDDFGAARNEALRASACPWILWMDADDLLDNNSKYELLNLLLTAPPQAAAFRIINNQNKCPGAQFMQVRLFPRMPGLVFERRVHEQIMFSAARSKVPFTQYPNIRIVHKGYNDPNLQKAKSARNLPLILAELQANPDDPALLLNYGDCCMALGQLDAARAAYSLIAGNRALQRVHPDVFVQAHFAVGRIHHKQREFTRAKNWFSECIRLDPTRTEAYFLMGRIFEEEGDAERAFDNYLKSARITPPLRQTATNAEKIRMESIHCLARLLIKEKRYWEAEELLLHAVAVYPAVVEYHTALGQALLMQRKLKEAAFFFMQSLSMASHGNTDGYAGMAIIYEMLQDHAQSKAFLEKAALESVNYHA